MSPIYLKLMVSVKFKLNQKVIIGQKIVTQKTIECTLVQTSFLQLSQLIVLHEKTSQLWLH